MSGFMGAAEEPAAEDAFNARAAQMPGVTFQEVADSSRSDIRIGFGDFDAANTGVVGLTGFNEANGQIETGTIVRVEDTAETALVLDDDGLDVYAGTDATLTQVLEHEIGHALGLGDNSDINSIMNYDLTSSNQTLDATDVAGISSLYGSSATVSTSNAGVNQLIQAMATFETGTGAVDSSLVAPNVQGNGVMLVSVLPSK
jgi:hypothetical protein